MGVGGGYVMIDTAALVIAMFAGQDWREAQNDLQVYASIVRSITQVSAL